jgi:hydroxypyruvate reductase
MKPEILMVAPLDAQVRGRAESDAPYVFYTKLVTMAADVDFLVVTAAGGEATRRAVDRPVLEALTPFKY